MPSSLINFRRRHVGERLAAWTEEHQARAVTAFSVRRAGSRAPAPKAAHGDPASPSCARRGWSRRPRPGPFRSTSPGALRRIAPPSAPGTRTHRLVVTEAWEARTVARAAATAPWGSARMCWTMACCRPRASPAGLSGRWPMATAHFITAPIRCRTRRAFSGLSCQIGVKDRRHVGRGHLGQAPPRCARERRGAQTARLGLPVPRSTLKNPAVFRSDMTRFVGRLEPSEIERNPVLDLAP